MTEILEQAHEALRQEQLKVQQDDQEEPLLFASRDLVWLQNKRRRKGLGTEIKARNISGY